MNNKWYQSAPCKGILIVLEHILAVVMITCLVFTFSYPGDNLAGILFEKPHKKYEQSKGFTDKLMSAVMILRLRKDTTAILKQKENMMKTEL